MRFSLSNQMLLDLLYHRAAGTHSAIYTQPSRLLAGVGVPAFHMLEQSFWMEAEAYRRCHNSVSLR